MSLLGPIATPLRSLLFSLGGAGLAGAWFSLSWMVPVAIVVLAWAVTLGLQRFAESQIARNPIRALDLLEWRLFGIVVVSAGTSALVIIFTVWFTLDGEQARGLSASSQETLAAVGAALTAFIGAVSVSSESADENVGDVVREKFREKFVFDDLPVRNDQRFVDPTTEAGRKADRALNSNYDYGWTDWCRANRRERVQALHDYVQSQKEGRSRN